MSEDGKFYSVAWVCCTVIILALIIVIGINYRLNTRDFIKAGYTKAMLPGDGMARWVKR